MPTENGVKKIPLSLFHAFAVVEWQVIVCRHKDKIYSDTRVRDMLTPPGWHGLAVFGCKGLKTCALGDLNLNSRSAAAATLHPSFFSFIFLSTSLRCILLSLFLLLFMLIMCLYFSTFITSPH